MTICEAVLAPEIFLATQTKTSKHLSASTRIEAYNISHNVQPAVRLNHTQRSSKVSYLSESFSFPPIIQTAAPLQCQINRPSDRKL